MQSASMCAHKMLDNVHEQWHVHLQDQLDEHD